MGKEKCTDGRRFNRPPVGSRFKPGQTGNKKGRPKKPPEPSLDQQVVQIIGDVLKEEVPVALLGENRSLPLLKAALMTALMQAAKKGNVAAVDKAMSLA